MKITYLAGLVVLGLAAGHAAHAQTLPAASPVLNGPPGSLSRPIPADAVPTQATTPTAAGTNDALYPNGVPTRNVNGGTQRADQPVRRNPPVLGGQPGKSLRKSRP